MEKYTKELIVRSEENCTLLQTEDKCDKYDYLIAIACGAIGGMVDIFLVGSPENSLLTKWTDAQVDNAVMAFAKSVGWSPKAEKTESVASAIAYLEKNYKVNYDHRHSADVGNAFNMSANNHHMMSLAHSPDILGLFFSILNQFTSTASFVANGQLVTIKTETFELQGGNFIAKIFCGIVNWLGHIMSDIAGSSGSRGNLGRGSGVVIPFYELFGLCKFGKFSVEKDRQDLAVIATRAFQAGYDLRFGIATAIPVMITDLLIRLLWALRRYFQKGMPIKDCVPSKNHSDLRVMLIWGNGMLCLMDGVDAGIRSKGNFLMFFMRLNLIAWFRLAVLVLKEVCIRVGIAAPLQAYLDAYKRINEALLTYLSELEKIDIELFKRETDEVNKVISSLEDISSKEELNKVLLETFEKMKYDKPWQGDFNEYMQDKDAVLVFQ